MLDVFDVIKIIVILAVMAILLAILFGVGGIILRYLIKALIAIGIVSVAITMIKEIIG